MAAHGADAYTQAIDRNGACGQAENLVGFRAALPLFPALSVAEILVDPGNQRTGQRHPKIGGGKPLVPQNAGHFPVDVQNGRGRIIEQRLGDAMRLAHLLQQLAHVLGAGAGSSLIGHRCQPLDQASLE